MNTQSFSQYSETHKLLKVIIGRYQGYAEAPEYIEIVNEDQKKGLPSLAVLQREFDTFRAVLEAKGVEVLIPERVGPFVYDQLTPRDIGVTIGNRFLVCNMAKSSRRYEIAGVFKHIVTMQGEPPAVIIPPSPDILLEGGDILVDGDKIFVGLAQRTNEKGFEFIKQLFGHKFKLIAVKCVSLEEGENVLHLDCTFNRIGKDYALIYPEGFSLIPEEIRQYRWIELSASEQALLGTNVLSINSNTIIARDHPGLHDLNNRIRKAGFEVIEIPFDGATATGGSFRCCSLPLVRSSD